MLGWSWSSNKPMAMAYRFLCVTSGFILTKYELFPVQAARGAGQIVLVRRSRSMTYYTLSFILSYHRTNAEHRPPMPHVLSHRPILHVRQHPQSRCARTPEAFLSLSLERLPPSPSALYRSWIALSCRRRTVDIDCAHI